MEGGWNNVCLPFDPNCFAKQISTLAETGFVFRPNRFRKLIQCFNQKSSSKSPRLRLLLTLEFTMHIYNSYYAFNDNDGNLFYRYKTGGGIYILKFFPANYIDKNLKNGYGVMMDDIIAGIYTILTLMILNAFI